MLKKRVEAQATIPRRDPVPRPAFVELTASPLGTSPLVASGECLIELANAAGASLRIHLKGHEVPDLVVSVAVSGLPSDAPDRTTDEDPGGRRAGGFPHEK